MESVLLQKGFTWNPQTQIKMWHIRTLNVTRYIKRMPNISFFAVAVYKI